MSATPDQVIARYIELRNEKAALNAKLADEIKPINEKMELAERWLLQKLNEQNVQSVKTSEGTAYKTVQTSVSIADGEAFRRFVFQDAAHSIAGYLKNVHDIEVPGIEEALVTILMSFNNLGLVNISANKTEVQGRIDDGDELPPGLNMTKIATIGVRKA